MACCPNVCFRTGTAETCRSASRHTKPPGEWSIPDKGIRINAVCPGIIGNTPMAARVTMNYDPDIIKAFVAAEPIGRLGEPDEIAAAVWWLCSPAASFVLGHALAIDGGILA
jgi:NAD(P)-dependent dehydrogenase (short-subunit alcohol dehydrogenase family)